MNKSERHKLHFSVAPAEAKGFRYFIETRSKPDKQGNMKTHILKTKWFPSEGEAKRALARETRGLRQ